VSGYEILEELGRGGMGVVYKARQLRLNRLVALKMILAGAHADPADLARFQIEAEAVARLQHPNIVQIYEVGECNGRPYFSLEFVEGGSLHDRLDGTPQPLTDAARMIETLARAVHYAHERGIVHRDLKPANILLHAKSEIRNPKSESGTGPGIDLPDSDFGFRISDLEPKVTDFGLAKQLDSEQCYTHTGAVLGTPMYMAPEQAEGRIKDIGPCTDIYALGAILYHLLTGRPPFRGATILETLEQVRLEDPLPPSRLQPRLPRDLDTICLRCLEKHPLRRYATAAALADDLHRFLNGQPILARPTSLWERTVKWARRRPAVAGLLAALALVVVLAFAGMTWLWLDAARERDAAAAARQHAERQEQLARAAEQGAVAAADKASQAKKAAEENYQTARRNGYATYLGLAQTALRHGRPDRAIALLKEVERPKAGEEDLRNFEWHYLWRLCHSRQLSVEGHADAVTHVALSGDGRRMATASLDQTVKIWAIDSSREVTPVTELRGAVRGLAFRPGHAQLATATADGKVRLWAAEDPAHCLLALDAHPGGAASVAFSPDGKLLLSGGEDHRLKVWDADAGKLLHELTGHRYPVTCVVFSPDGKRVASASEDRTVRVWSLESGAEQARLTGHGHWVSSVAFSPDGKQLATGSWDHTVKVWKADTGECVRTMIANHRPVRSLAFSPAGQHVAAVVSDGDVLVWDLREEQPPKVRKSSRSLVRTVAFSHDGELMASVAFDQRVSDATPPLRGFNGPVLAVAVTPNGKRVIAAGCFVDAERQEVRGEAKVWDLATRLEFLALRGHGASLRSVACSADGSLLALGGEDEVVLVVQADTGAVKHTLQGHRRRVTCVRFSPDGQALASSSEDETARLWDLTGKKEPITLAGHRGPVRAVAFSPAAAQLATAGADGAIRVWDQTTGAHLQTLTAHGDVVTAIAYSQDGKYLASASADQSVKIWDARTRQVLRTLRGHTDSVTAVVFSPDGKRVASGSADHTIKLWDVISGLETLTLRGHIDGVTGLAFTPDGAYLASSSWDQTVRIWDGRPGESDAAQPSQ
jgi:WD40 repeat protein